jgi:hypothetical protein
MDRKNILPVVLAVSIICEMLTSAHQFDSAVPQPHIEFEIAAPFMSSVSTISVNMVSVIYISSGRMDEVGKPGQMTERIMFSSVRDAMSAPFPVGYESAALWTRTGRYVYHSPRFGWEAY